MRDELKNILSEEEQEKLSDSGITILDEDLLELVSGGGDSHTSVKKGHSTVVYQSVIRSSMMSCKCAGIGGGNGLGDNS